MALSPEQLEMRRKGVFASDMPRIARLLPAKWERVSWADLWDEKTGAVPAWEGNATTKWGEIVEPVIAAQWSEMSGRAVRRNTESKFHPTIPIIGATVDYFTDDEEAIPIEIKNVGMYMAKKWNGKIPDYVEVQVQTQLAVCGKEKGFVAARLEGSENIIDAYVVPFRPDVWDHLVNLATEFWKFVERGERPND